MLASGEVCLGLRCKPIFKQLRGLFELSVIWPGKRAATNSLLQPNYYLVGEQNTTVNHQTKYQVAGQEVTITAVALSKKADSYANNPFDQRYSKPPERAKTINRRYYEGISEYR